MRKIALLLSCIFLLFTAACSCALEKQSLDKLEANLHKQQADHDALMKSANRPADQVADWDKLYLSDFDVITNLKKSAK